MTSKNRFENRRLREDALEELVKALHTDRMVAVTGAMSTEALGYPSWDDFTVAYALVADELAGQILKARGKAEKRAYISTDALLEDIRARAKVLIDDVKNREGRVVADRRVSMWTLHELFRKVDREMRQTRAGLVIENRYQTPAVDEFERRVGAIFLSRSPESKGAEQAAAIRPLIRSLGIKRFATLNYDLELERVLMLRRDEQELLKEAEPELSELEKSAENGGINIEGARSAARGDESGPTKAECFASKREVDNSAPYGDAVGVMHSIADFIGPRASGRPIRRRDRHRLSRTMGDGVHVESDVVDRERSDRLFEFAIGSAEISRHILHLHGRADSPDTMVANIRHYDRLYRLDDLYRDPFDHGLRMLMGGNPILFVGIGMNESEINDQLQYFVSNTPIRRPAPIFVLWNQSDAQSGDESQDEWERYKEARRLDFRFRLGVYLIFDDDFAPKSVAKGEAKPGEGSVSSTGSGRLAKFMEQLPQLVERFDRRIDRCPDEWRSIQRRIAASKRNGPCRMWGSKGLEQLHTDKKPQDRRLALPSATIATRAGVEMEETNLIFACAENGFGRGELSELLTRERQGGFLIGESKIAETQLVNRLMINAGFSYDSDAMLSGIARFLALRTDTTIENVTRCRERYFSNGKLLNVHKQEDSTVIIINGADRFFGSAGAPLSAEFDHFLRCVKHQGHNLQVVLLCTSRLRRYAQSLGQRLESLEDAVVRNLIEAEDEEPNHLELVKPTVNPKSSYLQSVADRFWKLANDRTKKDDDSKDVRERVISDAALVSIKRAETVDREAHTKAFFEAYLAPPLLRALGISCPATFETLRTLSFIGTPVEGVVLLYAPKVRAILAERNELIEGENGAGMSSLRTDALTEQELRAALAKILRDLCKLGLLIELDSHDPKRIDVPTSAGSGSAHRDDNQVLWARYGMHRSLATFLRDRHGAPINDAKLATSFNMSLFMSEESDANTPEMVFHDELGALTDTLLKAGAKISHFQTDTDLGLADLLTKAASAENASSDDTQPNEASGEQEEAPGDQVVSQATLGKKWHDEIKERKLSGDDSNSEAMSLEDTYLASADRDKAEERLPWLAHRDSAACLRAALAVVRGYFSTGALLRFDRSDRTPTSDRDGALTEHAKRLDRLISAFGDVAVARTLLRNTAECLVKPSEEEADGDEEKDKSAKKPTGLEGSRFEAETGPEPFYADDLVWLLNERGTVALAQGDLFEARDALSAAERVNMKHVECDHKGHNWRRIALGWVGVRIERGSLKPAERLLDEVEVAINSANWNNKNSKSSEPRVNQIRDLINGRDPDRMQGTEELTREEIFTVAMTTGYRGLIGHLRGRYHESRDYYVVAVKMLREMGENRAYAHFQRHWATLEGFFGDKVFALKQIEYAIAAAQASRQMDILHRTRVVRADLVRETSQDESERRHALQEIKEALRYAAMADCYRVRIEASASLARHMRIGGDYDTALRYGVDAMTIAARYGHSLQKTSLRIELGRILEARGDPISGRALLDQAIAIGTSKGHYHALERVRRALNAGDAGTNWAYLNTADRFSS